MTKYAHVTPGFHHATHHRTHRRHSRGYFKEKRKQDMKRICDHIHSLSPPPLVVSSSKMFADAVLRVSTLMQLRHIELLRLPLLSQEFHKVLTLDEEMSNTFWRCLCASFAREYGLFLPLPQSSAGTVAFSAWRSVFADDLWPARKKWNVENWKATTSQFKIKVSVRFRPAEKVANTEKVSLPLHQLLRMKRRGAKNRKQSDAQPASCTKINFGGHLAVPEHLLDAMTSRIMSEPRRLPSSGRVMDLSVLTKMLARDQHDPFDGTPLNLEDLVLCPTLEKDLEEFHRKEREGREDGAHPERGESSTTSTSLNNVSIESIQKLAESGAEISSEILEMLMEAEALAVQSKRAEQARRTGVIGQDYSVGSPLHVGSPLGEEGPQPGGEGGGPETNVDNDVGEDMGMNLISASSLSTRDGSLSLTREEADNSSVVVPPPWEKNVRKRKVEKPKFLSVQKSRVNFYVPGSGVRQFLFPRCFGGESTQSEVYSSCARSAVFAALNGMSSAVLSYGQTGSGKTYTQFGAPGWESTLEKEMSSNTSRLSTAGCVVRSIVDVLDVVQRSVESGDINIQVSASYVQIYQNKCTDLMTNGACVVHSNTGDLSGCSAHAIENVSDALSILKRGEKNKRFASTAMNDRSSRAHTIFTMFVSQSMRGGAGGPEAADENGTRCALVQSKLFFVDLAGSERVKRSKVTGETLSQAIGINQSLHVLGKVIHNLIQGKSHVPYLESRLTTLLRGCFGGDCLTRVLVSCRSDNEHAEESLNSLRFGERCSRITNQVEHACTSVSSALSTIDSSISHCEKSVASLTERGMDTRSLRERHDLLVLKRRDLARLLKG